MINIENAKPDDAEEIQHIFYKTWLDTYPNEKLGITVEDIEDRYKDKLSKEGIQKVNERILNLDSNSAFFVAKENGIIIGVCKIIKLENINQLGAIYVSPEHQGKGIGQMLWEKSLNFFDPEKDIKVEVATYNTKAINFYKKLGFIDTGERMTDDRLTFTSGATIPEMEMIISK